jgi:putative ABC transport system permease protein
MKTPLAWRNVLHSKVRSVIALCGVSFCILLIFMQLNFYGAAATNATQVYEALDFDLLVLSRQYTYLAHPGKFPRSRLEQLRAVDGVQSVIPVWSDVGEWRNPETRVSWHILALGVEPSQRPFRDNSLNEQLPLLVSPDNALIDSVSRPEHGHLGPGVTSELQHHRIRIVGRYRIGGGFLAGATLVTSRDTFLRAFALASADEPNIELVKLGLGVSPVRAAEEVNKRLWPVAVAVTRAELAATERHYWLQIKPIGLMFTAGIFIAFLAGAVVLYQVLTSEVQNRLREYATLKALGYGDRYVYGTIVRQAVIFCGVGFGPAFLGSLGLNLLIRTDAMVPVSMTLTRVISVLLLTFAMCFGATLLAVRKLRQADPADLF